MAWLGDISTGVGMFSRLSRGERFVVVAGGILLLSLVAFPWHRFEIASLLGGDPRRTAVQPPNGLQGTLAFLVTIAMVAQVIMSRTSSRGPNPALVRLQAPAGMAVVALLAWKLASEPSDLSVGAYLGLALAVALAYGGLIMNKESTPSSPRTTRKRRSLPSLRIGRKKAGPPTQPVIVIPPGEDGSEYAYIVDLNDHVAKWDGSFSIGRATTVGSRGEGIGFDTSAEAIRWAEERGWTVMNKRQL
jgi:hypothetical protein